MHREFQKLFQRRFKLDWSPLSWVITIGLRVKNDQWRESARATGMTVRRTTHAGTRYRERKFEYVWKKRVVVVSFIC